jgi:transcriptional regulator with XRE-family HTH domain
MRVFAERIRERARDLGLPDAEVARRAGLSERRYSYYATGEREPNLATLLLICDVLAATPNDLLLPEARPPVLSDRDRLLGRIRAATNNQDVGDLELAACQLECLTAHRLRPVPRSSISPPARLHRRRKSVDLLCHAKAVSTAGGRSPALSGRPG